MFSVAACEKYIEILARQQVSMIVHLLNVVVIPKLAFLSSLLC